MERHVSVQGCAGLPGTNRRRSSRLFPSKLCSNPPTMIPPPPFPPPRAAVPLRSLSPFLFIRFLWKWHESLFFDERRCFVVCRGIWTMFQSPVSMLRRSIRNLVLLGTNLRNPMTPTLLAPGLFYFLSFSYDHAFQFSMPFCVVDLFFPPLAFGVFRISSKL